MTGLRYDDTVHATDDGVIPVCGDSLIPSDEPDEVSLDEINCIWCKSLVF